VSSADADQLLVMAEAAQQHFARRVFLLAEESG